MQEKYINFMIILYSAKLRVKKALQQINRNDPQYAQATQMINRINSFGWSNMLKIERDNRCVDRTGWGSFGFYWR